MGRVLSTAPSTHVLLRSCEVSATSASPSRATCSPSRTCSTVPRTLRDLAGAGRARAACWWSRAWTGAEVQWGKPATRTAAPGARPPPPLGGCLQPPWTGSRRSASCPKHRLKLKWRPFRLPQTGREKVLILAVKSKVTSCLQSKVSNNQIFPQMLRICNRPKSSGGLHQVNLIFQHWKETMYLKVEISAPKCILLAVLEYWKKVMLIETLCLCSSAGIATSCKR